MRLALARFLVRLAARLTVPASLHRRPTCPRGFHIVVNGTCLCHARD